MRLTWAIGLGLLTSAIADEPTTSKETWDPTSHYRVETLRGWTLHVHQDFAQHESLWTRTREQLDHQAYNIERVVPVKALEQLKTIHIWVEVNHPKHPCMCYHVSEDWLREHQMNPAKAGCVELANAAAFLDWTHDQPWMLLHELAHGYHHQFLDGGYDNPLVRAAYEHAREEKLYDNVLRVQGRKEPHYALTNPAEYFAEATEAHFGTNDFFPFVRAELEAHDPDGAAVVRQQWGVRTSRAREKAR